MLTTDITAYQQALDKRSDLALMHAAVDSTANPEAAFAPLSSGSP